MMKKILIVDDNAQNLYILDILLKTNGFEVEQASNGVVALELAHQNPPDMVVSDILMPVMDGFNLCRNWMADERLKNVPFIFYTATYTDHKDEAFALSLGADRFLVKPTDPDEFLAVIQDVFKTHLIQEPVLPEPMQKEESYYKEYSEILIRKLEDKMMQLERTNKRLTALYQASCNLVSIKSKTFLIHSILRDIVETAGYQHANYFDFVENENKLFLLDAVGFSQESLTVFKDKLVFQLGEERGLVGLAAQNRQAINIPDTSQEPRWLWLDSTIHSALFIPVLYDESLLGVMALFSKDKDAFNDEDVHNIVTLVNSLAVTIVNIRVEETLNSQNGILTALINSPRDHTIFSLDRNYRYTTFNEKHRLEMKKKWQVDIKTGMNLLEIIPIPELRTSTQKSIDRALAGDAFIEIQYQPDKNMYNEFIWNPIRSNEENVVGVTVFIRDISERKQAEDKIRQLNADLERRVKERTTQLEATNKELETFAYSVSHDLRSPIRGIDGWSQALLEDYYEQLDENGRLYLNRVRSETKRMSHLIDDLLELSRVTRADMQIAPVDLSNLAGNVIARLREAHNDRQVECVIQPGLIAPGDSALLGIVFTNLLDNAWKFTSKNPQARIEFGQMEVDGRDVFFVRDNGIGFDMTYAHKLFGAFQRLHKASDFPGTGVGLATVQRIIRRHGGQIWADSLVNQGTTFFFTIGEIG